MIPDTFQTKISRSNWASKDFSIGLYCIESKNIIDSDSSMDSEHDVTEEDEEEELQRLDGDGEEEEEEADDIVVGDPKESRQESTGLFKRIWSKVAVKH